MAAKDTIDALEWLRKQIEQAPDPLREVLNEVVTAIMGAEVDAICGARYGEPSADRVNYRNGYRVRAWDTRAGTIPLDIRSFVTDPTFLAGFLSPAGEPRRH